MFTTGAHGIHKITNILALTNIMLCVELSTGRDHLSTFLDKHGSQWDVGGDHQVIFRSMFRDKVVCHVEALFDLQAAYKRRRRYWNCVIGHQCQHELLTLRRAK